VQVLVNELMERQPILKMLHNAFKEFLRNPLEQALSAKTDMRAHANCYPTLQSLLQSWVALMECKWQRSTCIHQAGRGRPSTTRWGT
jgi:hypothetical protein